MYAINYTRPDIAFAVSMLSRFTKNPSEEHRTAIERVMAYLKGTMHCALHFTGYPTVIEVYLDASWGREKEGTSTGEFVFLLGGATISWKSKKQSIISKSSMESKFYALAATVVR